MATLPEPLASAALERCGSIGRSGLGSRSLTVPFGMPDSRVTKVKVVDPMRIESPPASTTASTSRWPLT